MQVGERATHLQSTHTLLHSSFKVIEIRTDGIAALVASTGGKRALGWREAVLLDTAAPMLPCFVASHDEELRLV